MENKKATGFRGSWFASVDGEMLPCVHKHWWQGGTLYNDPELDTSPKALELVDAIKSLKEVIVTTDDTVFHADRKITAFTRTGYVGVYRVDDIEFDAAGLRFKFVTRVCSLT